MRSNPRSDGLRASDAEITRPLNEGPFEEEQEQPPAWHVHLELNPEELATLHRMGFTSGAVAWREGMNDWQPLKLGPSPPLAPPHQRSEQSVSGNLPMALVRRRTPASDFDAERSGGKERTISQTELAPRLQAFTRRARTIPPLASPMSIPVIGSPSPPNLAPLPPPPPLPSEKLPNFDAWDTAAHLSSHTSLPYLSDSAIREIKPLSVPPPPVELPNRPLRAGSRALWLGAAALVALSASNGALVSALLWSLRHSATASVAALSRSFNASMCPAPTASPATGAPKSWPTASTAPAAAVAVAAPASVAAPALPKVSIEELPLASDTKPEHAAVRPRPEAHSTTSRAEAHSATPRSAAPGTSKAARAKAARAAIAEEAASKKAAPSAEAGPDRESMAKALSLASASASTCSDGPERGRVAVTFSASGSVQGVRLIQPFADASVNSCVLRAMGRAHVTPFSGDSVTVTKTLSW